MSRSMDIQSLSDAEWADLRQVNDMIQLFHHRNKNQHRRSTWWRHFCAFRHQLILLIKEMTSLREVPTTHVARIKKKTQDLKTKERVQHRLTFWQDIMVAKWEHAFSQLTADGRFAVLGLVLTAVLAQVCKLTGLTAIFEELGRVEVEKILEEFGKEDWGLDAPVSVSRPHKLAQEDVGEVINRTEKSSGQAAAAAAEVTTETLNLEPSMTVLGPAKSVMSTRKSKKKRKKGDAIDDLFAGLD